MESVGLEMDDIFGSTEEQGAENEDIGALQNNEEEEAADAEDENTFNANINKKLAKGATKKVVRNPQPKLNDARLSGERGIAILPKLFKDVTFKGNGHEAKDLDKILKILEHWAHRLFPQMKFSDCLQRIEKIGSKKSVQSCIKRIRLDMPVLDDDFVSNQVDDEDEDGNPNNTTNAVQMDEVTAAEAAWDEMMRSPNNNNNNNSVSSTSYLTSPPSGFSTPSTTNRPPSQVTVLSAEMKEKIAKNKQLALEKRAARLAANQNTPQRQNTSQNEEITAGSQKTSNNQDSSFTGTPTPSDHSLANPDNQDHLQEVSPRKTLSQEDGDSFKKTNCGLNGKTEQTPGSVGNSSNESDESLVGTDRIVDDNRTEIYSSSNLNQSTVKESDVCQSVADMDQSTVKENDVCQGVTDMDQSTVKENDVCQGVTNMDQSTVKENDVCQSVTDMDQSTVKENDVCQGVTDMDHSTVTENDVHQSVTDMDQSPVKENNVLQGVTDTHQSPVKENDVCLRDKC
ncbi:uncharacterized protein DDB_G0286591-like isoform X5 [Octopus sinensis]|uniref:TIMELESS-interacting protein n=1 Tax=Octopus sinensis TaxID=2607531 RepID=A0A7E6F8G2_9MOLL|nr:uncharacterized protein DDB_G0286591-like isoform X5 [Octopus sinensis]